MARLHVLGVAVMLLAAASCAPPPAPEPSTKLDRALREWTRHPTASARVLIRARSGASARVLHRLGERATRRAVAMTMPDLIEAELSIDALQNAIRDEDVVRISSDATVKSFGSALAQNVLLGTEGLLTPGGALSTQYTGHNIGVAVIDSGVTAGDGDLSAITFYDVTNHMKQGGNYDDYGHGTHVSGLVASNGSFSNYQYQGIAPSVQLIEMKVLDKNGNGYTSDVINAINFAVANKSWLHIDVINLSLGHPIYESAATDPLVQSGRERRRRRNRRRGFGGQFRRRSRPRMTPATRGITSPGNAPNAITVGALETNQTVDTRRRHRRVVQLTRADVVRRISEAGHRRARLAPRVRHAAPPARIAQDLSRRHDQTRGKPILQVERHEHVRRRREWCRRPDARRQPHPHHGRAADAERRQSHPAVHRAAGRER